MFTRRTILVPRIVGRGGPLSVCVKRQADFAAVMDKHADAIPTARQIADRNARESAAKAKVDAWVAADKIANPSHYI